MEEPLPVTVTSEPSADNSGSILEPNPPQEKNKERTKYFIIGAGIVLLIVVTGASAAYFSQKKKDDLLGTQQPSPVTGSSAAVVSDTYRNGDTCASSGGVFCGLGQCPSGSKIVDGKDCCLGICYDITKTCAELGGVVGLVNTCDGDLVNASDAITKEFAAANPYQGCCVRKDGVINDNSKDGVIKDNGMDCENIKVFSRGSWGGKEIEADRGLQCLGERIIKGCQDTKVIIERMDGVVLKVSVKNDPVRGCRISFDHGPITDMWGREDKIYSNSSITCMEGSIFQFMQRSLYNGREAEFEKHVASKRSSPANYAEAIYAGYKGIMRVADHYIGVGLFPGIEMNNLDMYNIIKNGCEGNTIDMMQSP